jgi:DNA repair protein RadC
MIMSNQAEYGSVTHLPNPSDENAVIRQAIEILDGRSRVPEWYVQNNEEVKNYLRVRLAAEHGRECLFALFLDARSGVIEADVLYQGGIEADTFKLRGIVQRTLACNAAGVVFAHNRPPGGEAWSHTDQLILARLVEALSLVDVKVPDYFLVGDETGVYSFYEHGRL